MKLTSCVFTMLLASVTLAYAAPAGISRDCGFASKGKRALSVSYFYGKQQFFTTMYADAYIDPNKPKLGTEEIYHHSVYCPANKVPCWQFTVEDMAWLNYPSPYKYAPGVRGTHRWKTSNGTILTVYSHATHCTGYNFVEF